MEFQRGHEPSDRPEDMTSQDEYLPGICNIDRKGRWLRGGASFVGLVFVVIYNEQWQTVLTHPVLYSLGMVLLSTGTALSLIQAMASFCVVDGLLGRTFIPGSRQKGPVSAPENRLKDRKRALVLIGGALICGMIFSAVLLVSEINSAR